MNNVLIIFLSQMSHPQEINICPSRQGNKLELLALTLTCVTKAKFNAKLSTAWLRLPKDV